jgi:hypothetical protein
MFSESVSLLGEVVNLIHYTLARHVSIFKDCIQIHFQEITLVLNNE